MRGACRSTLLYLDTEASLILRHRSVISLRFPVAFEVTGNKIWLTLFYALAKGRNMGDGSFVLSSKSS